MRSNPSISGSASLRAWNASVHLADLQPVDAARLVPRGKRAVIVAPHPDDEVLGCGGLLQQLAELGRSILIISVTDGSASHPGSQQWTPQRLGVVRPQESAQALRRLGLPLHSLQWLRGGFSDGGVAGQERQLVRFLERYLRADDVVFSTWREDGHSDNEAVGRACHLAASTTGCAFYELPIWTWHWASPEDSQIPWYRARKLQLSPEMVARKRHAAYAFASQLQGDPAAGLPPVLAPYVLERLLRPFEVIFV